MYWKFHPRKVLTILVFLLIGFNSARAQTELAKKQETYQNLQRASNLIILRSNIKLFDDAPQRCFFRPQIIYFIFENKVTKYYDAANSLAVECLDETVNNKVEFSLSQSNRQKSEILLLLRKYLPETAKKIEKKYFADEKDTDLAEELAARIGQDPNGVADRIIPKIALDEVTSSIGFIISELRKVNNAAAMRLLSAVLDYYETHLEEAYSGNELIFLSSEFRDDKTPIELRRRFYNLMVRLGFAYKVDKSRFFAVFVLLRVISWFQS